MKLWLKACFAEVQKQNRNYYNSVELYLSMLLWPFLSGIGTYFIYKSFDLTNLLDIGISSTSDLLVFVFTGALAYNCFFSMIQSALFLRNERENGTLEIVFLSPANRLALVYGRALGGIIQNVGMFSMFTGILFIIIGKCNLIFIAKTLLCFVVVFLSSTVWGGLINAIFIVSRDVDFWFTLCDEPMKVFSGIEIPITLMPILFKIVGGIFPLTYCLLLIRQVFFSNNLKISIILTNIVVIILLIIITKIILVITEKINRKTGNLQFY